MRVNSTDTVAMGIRRANALWIPMEVLAEPLVGYAPLVPDSTYEWVRKQAKTLNQSYGSLLQAAKTEAGPEAQEAARTRIFRQLKEWAATVSHPEEWARALWNVVHTSKSTGSGSLPFIAFPAEIAAEIANAEAPDTQEIAILGVRFGDWAMKQHLLEDAEYVVKWTKRPFDGELRTAAYIGNDHVGYAPKASPVPQHKAAYHIKRTSPKAFTAYRLGS